MVDWLNISAISGSGNASITITAASHTELTRRLAAIKFKNTEHNLTAQTSVVQDAYVPEPIHVVVNPTSIDNIPQSGGSYEICVQSNGDWTVQVPSWATSTITSGSGNQCFTVTVDENDKESMNIGDIVISSVDETKYVPLIQEAYEPCDLSYTGNTGILYELDRVVFPVSGGSVDVAISTTHKWEAFVGRTDSEWLSITPTSGVGNGSVTVTAQPNHTANIRRTHDMFMTSEFTGFVESANESTRGVCGHQLFATQPYVKISEDLIFETDATAITTTLICDVEFNRLRVVSTEDWLHVSSRVTDFKIDISVDENTGEERTGYIQFYFEGILVYEKEVTQKTAQHHIIPEQDYVECGYWGDEFVINVNSDIDWEIASYPEWLLEDGCFKKDNTVVIIFPYYYNLYSDRSGEIILTSIDGSTSATISIKQTRKEVINPPRSCGTYYYVANRKLEYNDFEQPAEFFNRWTSHTFEEYPNGRGYGRGTFVCTYGGGDYIPEWGLYLQYNSTRKDHCLVKRLVPAECFNSIGEGAISCGLCDIDLALIESIDKQGLTINKPSLYMNHLSTLGSQGIRLESNTEKINFADSPLISLPSSHIIGFVKEIEYPSSLSTIDGYAFSSLSSDLESLIFNSETPPAITGYTTNVFPTGCTIYVPCQSLDAYKTADVWKDYSDRIACGNPDVTFIYLSQESANTSYDSSTVEFDVTSNGNWTATTDSNWITVNPSVGTGNAHITVNVAQNMGESRNGEITFETESSWYAFFNVNQASKPSLPITYVNYIFSDENYNNYLKTGISNEEHPNYQYRVIGKYLDNAKIFTPQTEGYQDGYPSLEVKNWQSTKYSPVQSEYTVWFDVSSTRRSLDIITSKRDGEFDITVGNNIITDNIGETTIEYSPYSSISGRESVDVQLNNMKINTFQIIDENNVVIFDGHAALYNGKAGLYDAISDTFIDNATYDILYE